MKEEKEDDDEEEKEEEEKEKEKETPMEQEAEDELDPLDAYMEEVKEEGGARGACISLADESTFRCIFSTLTAGL